MQVAQVTDAPGASVAHGLQAGAQLNQHISTSLQPRGGEGVELRPSHFKAMIEKPNFDYYWPYNSKYTMKNTLKYNTKVKRKTETK